MRRRQVELGAGLIEVEIDGVTVRVGRGADARTVTAVLRALKDGT
jgi:transposase